MTRGRARGRRRSLALLLAALVVLLTAAAPAPAPNATGSDARTTAPPSTAPPAIPVLAYYYIWFNPSSWDRAKRDTPLLGTYSSDERSVMRKHVELAKAAGIDGFLVSWKDTPLLTERLARLVEVARELDFHLGIVYQGLDFSRDPIPVAKVAADLQLLARTYSGNPVFDILGSKPLVVWTGTDDFSTADQRAVVTPVAGRLTVLASSRSVPQWQRASGLFAGNAWYWSSVNPDKSWYPAELAQMGAAVHAGGGLWVAPAAAGFDARLIGGKSVVPREDGQTLLKELRAAVASAPDALGVISWNEFTENSHIEPSVNYGQTALSTLATFTGADQPLPNLDSSTARTAAAGAGFNGVAALTVMIALLGALLIWTRWRRAPRHRLSGQREAGPGGRPVPGPATGPAPASGAGADPH